MRECYGRKEGACNLVQRKTFCTLSAPNSGFRRPPDKALSNSQQSVNMRNRSKPSFSTAQPHCGPLLHTSSRSVTLRRASAHTCQTSHHTHTLPRFFILHNILTLPYVLINQSPQPTPPTHSIQTSPPCPPFPPLLYPSYHKVHHYQTQDTTH